MLIQIKEIYELVYRKFSGNQLFELNLENDINKKNVISFSNQFIKKYRGSIDDEFLLNFIVFQFRYYENAKTRAGKNKIYLNWILGKKAIKRWEEKPDNWLYWNRCFILKHSLSLPKKNIDIDENSKNFYLKIERKRFFNTDQGLLHCLELDLFDRYCRECLVCKNKNICGNAKMGKGTV